MRGARTTLAVVLVALLAPAAARAGTARPVSVTLTTYSLRHALSPMPALRWGRVHRDERTITVDDAVRYQRVIGFGAAMTDSSAWLLHDELSAARRRAIMASLFGRDGIGLSFVRVPIGASDFTHDGVPYSYDDMPRGATDPALAHFSIAHDRAYVLPMLREMRALDPSAQLLASPWSAPGWMKANDALDNVGETGMLLGADYGVYARYLVRFLQAYRAAGVPVDAITPSNESGAMTEYPGMNLDEPAFIVDDLAPALRAAGLSTAVDDLDSATYTSMLQQLATPGLAQDIAGIAWHCYSGMQQMTLLHAADPGAAMILSECSPGIVVYPTAEIAIDALDNEAQAVDLWNLALDPAHGPKQLAPGCFPCSGVVTVNERTHRARPNRNYFQLGQVSRFVRRGAVRIGANRFVTDYADAALDDDGGPHGVSAGLDDAAFLDPGGEHVLVAYDNSRVPVSFQVAWGGHAFSDRLGPRAMVTFTWR